MSRQVGLSAALAVHLLVAAGHGVTHGLVAVSLPAWQNVIVVGTTFVGPIAGVLLARRGHRLGAPLFAMSLVGALAVGGYLHFVLDNPDHVHAIPAGDWRLPFQASAVAVALTEAVGTVVGVQAWQGTDKG
ncbi:hypothetical protein NDI85_07430 [Halomicroarcula sp. S1AR25-4]|uniref:hypothetical protein n=1 Tax=Haloarcula sp. S1AR25-4 TaxID=2950538 RepID=UPI002875DF6B|nr:hypothetical protein [Halomicroarcula sp. S1AR25-4]MDS0277620.1 hypothetical protein [Halomicroarcula sp. S1AR25-4]